MPSPWEHLYDAYAKLPGSVRVPLRPFISSPLSLRWFVLYAFIGLCGVGFYLLLLWCFLRVGLLPLVATATASVITATLQFAVNRNANFRAFDRAVAHQASSYATIAVLILLLTLAIVAALTRLFPLSPFNANLLTLLVTCPLAYLANRYVTFGPGIFTRLRDWFVTKRSDA